MGVPRTSGPQMEDGPPAASTPPAVEPPVPPQNMGTPSPADLLDALLNADFGERYLPRAEPALKTAFLVAIGAPEGATVDEVINIPEATLESALGRATIGDPALPLSGIQVSRIMGPIRRAGRDIQTLRAPPVNQVAVAPVVPPGAWFAPDGSLLVQTTTEDAQVVPS